VLRGDFDWQSQAVEALWLATALPFEAAGLAAFHRDRWLLLNDAQQRTLLRQAARRLLGGLHDVSYRPIAAAAQFSRTATPGRSCQVTGGLSLVISAEQVRLVTDAFRFQRPDSQFPLVQPGGGLAAGWRLEIYMVPAAEWREPGQISASRWNVAVDADRLSSPLTVRSRRSGDRFAPLGMAGHHMKLSDFMVNEKMPVALRNQWPLVVSGDDIIWVAGLRLDERFRVRDETQHVVRLTLVGPQPSEDK
jgi:tRNA(Ile)-lysidine synthase